MMDETLDERRVSAAQKQSFFREVNERIEELSNRWSSPAEHVCECLDMSCSQTVVVTAAEYERFRGDGNLFFVLKGHEVAEIEATVEENERFIVVRKLGVGATQAIANDPRDDREVG